MISWPRRKYFLISSAAARMNETSGSFVFRNGVGTQMIIASHSFSWEKFVVALNLPVSTNSLIDSDATSPM